MSAPEFIRDTRSLPDRLAEVLRARIIAGEWGPGERLPSEQALSQETGVSRPTVRAALRSLAASGLVHVRQGAGTFVATRGAEVVTGLQDLRSTSALIKEQKGDCIVTYRRRELKVATKEESERFDASHPLRVIAVERSFVSQGSVIAFEEALINAEVLPANFDPQSFSGSIFDQLEPLGLLPERSIATVRAVYDEGVAWSDEKPVVPLYLCLTQTQFLKDGRPLSWSKTYFTDGNFEFLVIRTR